MVPWRPESCLSPEGSVTTVVSGVPVGLGEPCFDKLEALKGEAVPSDAGRAGESDDVTACHQSF